MAVADDNAPLLFEAAWTLTNISSGTSEHTRVVIDNGAIPIFVGLIRCAHADVREQAVWALGNIAGDSTRCRDLVLSYDMPLGLICGLLEAMGDLSSTSTLTLLRNATWTVSNLCRGKPPPRWGLVAELLAPLITLLHHSDEEVTKAIPSPAHRSHARHASRLGQSSAASIYDAARIPARS